MSAIRPLTALPPHRRTEVDREDLMREATALRIRGEFQIPGLPTTVIAGYRAEGALSIYLGPERCYHFDPAGRLRRAYVEGQLYRTQGSTLARLQRHRSAADVVLQRHDLSADECRRFLTQVEQDLRIVHGAFESGAATALQQIPAGASLVDRLSVDLSQLLAGPLTCAPPIAGKR